MEEFEYLDEKENNELVKIITEMIDYEETAKALMVLEDRDSAKALELGEAILKYNKGDEYLQATVWNILFDDDNMRMIKAIACRTEVIGKTLLDEIITDLATCELDFKHEFISKLEERYNSLSDEEKETMYCDYEEFERKMSGSLK